MTEAAMYRLKDSTGQTLYVGISVNWASRLSQHSLDKAWWTEVRSVEIERYSTREDAQNAERVAIETEQPLFNQRAGGGGKPPKSQDIVGYWFLGDREHQWQGRIVKVFEDRTVLVQVLRWIDGEPSYLRWVPFESVQEWMLFESHEEFTQMYESLGGWDGWCRYLGIKT